MKLTSIHIYPVKSLGGYSVGSASLCPTGLQYDRRWMLVDEHSRFISQREHHQLALWESFIEQGKLIIRHKEVHEKKIAIPIDDPSGKPLQVNIWDDQCEAIHLAEEYDEWLSFQLGISVKLVFMTDHSRRTVDPDYARSDQDFTSFSDGFPILIIGEASLQDLNNRLKNSIGMDRFRPNLVFSGGLPFEEDTMQTFCIGSLRFNGVKLCSRCVMTTIDQATGEKGKEPLATLAAYRQKNNKIYFGQNVLGPVEGKISVGDQISVLQRKPALL